MEIDIFMFTIGNALVLLSTIPAMIRLFKTWSVYSFSFVTVVVVWVAFHCFMFYYISNGLTINYLLNIPSLMFYSSVIGLKIRLGKLRGKKR